MTAITVKPHRNGPECKNRVEMRNAADVKRAAASKLRDRGHKLPTSVRSSTIAALIEAETGRPIPEDTFIYMLRFLDDKPPEAAVASQINYMQRAPLRFSRQLQDAAQRSEDHPKMISMASSVITFRELDHIGF